MLFQAKFEQFSYEEFYAFICGLMQKHNFWYIRFIPATNPEIFSVYQLEHAAPDHDLSNPSGFIGQWKKNEDKVRRVSFTFKARNGSPDIRMTVDLDDRTISLDSAAGISPQQIKAVLRSSFSRASDVEIPKITEQVKERIIRELEIRGANHPCPRCGNSSFTLLDGYFNQTITSDLSGAILFGDTSVPSVIATCTQCGFLSQHALGALGLLPGGNPQ